MRTVKIPDSPDHLGNGRLTTVKGYINVSYSPEREWRPGQVSPAEVMLNIHGPSGGTRHILVLVPDKAWELAQAILAELTGGDVL